MVGSWPWKVLLTAFAFVAKICAVLRATLLFMHLAVYMLMEERSIHIMILTLQYFITDSISSLKFVIDDFFSRKWNPYYKITGQELIPVKIRRNSDARVLLAPFLPFSKSCLFNTCYSSAICGLIHGLLYLYSLQIWTFTNWNNFGCYRCCNQILVTCVIFSKLADHKRFLITFILLLSLL